MTDPIILPPGVDLSYLTCADYETDFAKKCNHCQDDQLDICDKPIARFKLECLFCRNPVVIDFPTREIADTSRIDKAVLEHLKTCLDAWKIYDIELRKNRSQGR